MPSLAGTGRSGSDWTWSCLCHSRPSRDDCTDHSAKGVSASGKPLFSHGVELSQGPAELLSSNL